MRLDAFLERGFGDARAQTRLTGCAIETCATMPLPKNELSRLWVRSTNWSTSTKVPGGKSSLNEPQADSETRSVTPTRFKHVDIGAVVDVRRRKPVALVVARQEHHRQPCDLADAQCARGSPHGLCTRSSRTFSRPGRS